MNLIFVLICAKYVSICHFLNLMMLFYSIGNIFAAIMHCLYLRFFDMFSLPMSGSQMTMLSVAFSGLLIFLMSAFFFGLSALFLLQIYK